MKRPEGEEFPKMTGSSRYLHRSAAVAKPSRSTSEPTDGSNQNQTAICGPLRLSFARTALRKGTNFDLLTRLNMCDTSVILKCRAKSVN